MSGGLWIANPTDRLLLASQSITRQRMLAVAGVVFETIAPPVDEQVLQDELIREKEPPKSVAERLAMAKATAASSTAPDALVLAADQTLDLEGALGVKPRDMADAAHQLASMSGKTHCLHSAYCFAQDGAVIDQGVRTASLKMRRMDAHAIDAYLKAAGPGILSSVGVYQVENLGVHLFEDINGDWFTILGMPLIEVLAFLRVRKMIL